MQALTLRAIKTPLVLEERDDLIPARGQVVVRVRAASLNRRDYWITQGMYPGIDPPVVLGSDAAGVVTRLGDDIGNFWSDREVIINPGMDWGDDQLVQSDQFNILGLPLDGTFATEVVVPVSQLHPKPDGFSWEQAAALPLAGITAYRALFTQGQLSVKDRVLISGIGGGVATFALQFAVAAGAQVWVTSSSAEKIAKAVSLGAIGGFDYRQEDWWKQMLNEAAAPNLIIDSAGGSGYQALLSLAAPGARIVNYGATAGPPEKLDLFKLFWKQLRLQGTTMGSPSDFCDMLEFVAHHRIEPVIDETYPLREGDKAITSMKAAPQFGKVVLQCEDA